MFVYMSENYCLLVLLLCNLSVSLVRSSKPVVLHHKVVSELLFCSKRYYRTSKIFHNTTLNLGLGDTIVVYSRGNKEVGVAHEVK